MSGVTTMRSSASWWVHDRITRSRSARALKKLSVVGAGRLDIQSVIDVRRPLSLI